MSEQATATEQSSGAKFINFEEFEVGGVYNKTYAGDNEAYKKQNGKTTIEILKIEDGQMSYTTLFATYPDFGPDRQFRTNPCSCNLEYLKRSVDYIYERVYDKRQYYKHVTTMSMRLAVKKGLITRDDVKRIFSNQSRNYIRQNPVSYVQRYDKDGNFSYPPIRSLRMSVQEGASSNPLLQTILFRWENDKLMKRDVLSVYKGAWFMN